MWVWLGWRCRIVDTKSDSQGLNPLGYLQNWLRFQRPTNSIKSDTISPKISKLGVGVNQFLRESEKLMASSPAANKVHNLETKRKSCIEGREFAPILWTFLLSDLFSNTMLILLSVLAKDSGYRDSIYTLKELGDIIHKSPDTVKGIISDLRKMGMIETKKAPKNAGLIITRTLFWDIVCPDKLRQAVLSFAVEGSGEKLPDSEVKKSPTLEPYHYINNKKKTAPPPEPPPEPPPNPPEKPHEKNEPAAVLFHKNTKEKLGQYHKAIAQYCAIIITMSGYSEKMNPIKIVKWALKSNVHPKAIEDSLKFVTSFKSLNEVDPYGVIKNRSGTKTQKYNAKDEENENDRRKKESIRNGKIVVLMKTV